jgi:hypothetical protein
MRAHSIREVISHLRERALRDDERERMAQEEARRAKEPSATEKQRALDAKAAEIRDAAKESSAPPALSVAPKSVEPKHRARSAYRIAQEA